MKRFIVLVLLASFFLFNHKVSLAQDEDSSQVETPVFDFDKALADYEHTYNQYRQAHLQYETAKTAYFKFDTLNSKNEALDKTALMLTLRDETCRTFLAVLRLKLAQVTNIDDYGLNLFYLNLDDQMVWYLKHANSFKSAGTLEDLLVLSRESEQKYSPSSLKIIYQTIHGIVDYKVEKNSQAVEAEVVAIRQKVNQIKQTGDKDVTLAERWLLEAENRLEWSKQKQAQSNETINQINQARYANKPETIFYQSRFLLEEANQYLKETNSYLLEVTKEIKNAD